jgi:hypothetical protein
LKQGAHPLTPFHWEIEFPEVFARKDGGFDAIIGNPPFLGGKRISSQLGDSYRDWLVVVHPDSNNNTDLVGQFFRRAFDLLRKSGSFGLVATNTIAQGDTRLGSLMAIVKSGGTIRRAIKRLAWPGEAAVIVSVIHIDKDYGHSANLDGQIVRRISSYLVEGDFDESPNVLMANVGKGFVGSVVLGMGFTFDDKTKEKSQSSSLEVMRGVIEIDAKYANRILPYIGGEEVNNDPRQHPHRYVFNLSDLDERTARKEWPLLLKIAEDRVKPQRSEVKRDIYRSRWWRFAEPQNALYKAIGRKEHVLAYELWRHAACCIRSADCRIDLRKHSGSSHF